MNEKIIEFASDVATEIMMERYLLVNPDGFTPEQEDCPLFDYDKETEMSSWKEEYQEEFDREYDKWYDYFERRLR